VQRRVVIDCRMACQDGLELAVSATPHPWPAPGYGLRVIFTMPSVKFASRKRSTFGEIEV
jgi:hypothetical protein